MPYLTLKERLALVYAVAAGITLLIACFAVLGASNGLETCLARHSASTCLYALR